MSSNSSTEIVCAHSPDSDDAYMFYALATEGINIEMISTSPIRVSCVVRREDGERAVRVVHSRFGLDP